MLRRLLTNKNLFMTINQPVPVLQVPVRWTNYYKSNLEESKDKYTEVEKSYAEWKYVEKLFPPVHVPEPPTDHKIQYPSGWRASNPKVNLPYHICRTKNHMLPIYFRSTDRGTAQSTTIRYVEGNIWALEKDIGRYLKDKYPRKPIVTHCHEMRRYINIRQDFVDDVMEWAINKGF